MERSTNGAGRSGDDAAARLPATIGEACLQASLFLEERGIGEPRANAELLLMHLLGLGKAELLRDWRDPFPPGRAPEWERLLARKAAGEPVQYITGEQWFYGLPFAVTPAVLIPRPETELLVEAVIEAADRLWPGAAGGASPEGGGDWAGGGRSEAAGERPEAGGDWAARDLTDGSDMGPPAEPGAAGDADGCELAFAEPGAVELDARNAASSASSAGAGGGSGAGVRAAFGGDGPTVVDVGTGSGAIGVTLAVQRPRWRVCASDLSPDALAVARTNAVRHGAEARMAFVQGDLLAPFAVRREGGADAPGEGGGPAGMRIDVLVSNPPYIPAEDIAGLQPEVRDYEPRLALDGGADGLAPYRQMLAQLPLLAAMPRIVAFELGLGQAEAVAAMLRSLGAWREVRTIRDYAGIDRHVIAIE